MPTSTSGAGASLPVEEPASLPLVAGVGASAGGLEAYTELLSALPANAGLERLLNSESMPRPGSSVD